MTRLLQRLARFPWLSTLIPLLATVILLRLGFWQLERAEHKRELFNQWQALQTQQPVSLDQLDANSAPGLPVQLQGNIWHERLFLLDNRLLAGQVGYDVVAPVQTAHGYVLMVLGWLPAPRYRDRLPVIKIGNDAGGLLHAYVYRPGDNPIAQQGMGAEPGWPKRVQRVDLTAAEDLLGMQLLPYLLRSSTPERWALQDSWQPINMPATKHVAYAIQWFGLALACVVITLVRWRQSLRRKNDN